MRVAHLCADPGVPVHGRKGSSVHVQEVVRALRNRGHEVALVAARVGGPAPPDLADVPVRRIELPGHDGTSEGREAARRAMGCGSAGALDDLGPLDLVYERYSLWGASGMAWARDAGIPGVLEVNAPLPEEQHRYRDLHDTAGAVEVARSAVEAATVVVTVSEPLRRWVLDVSGADPAKVHVVPNGVDVARFGPPSHRTGPEEAVTFGFVGTLKPWHGLDVLVDALPLVDPAVRWRLLVVGDGPERAMLEERSSGVAGEVELVGAADPGAVPALLRRVDVAVAPYPGSATYFSPLKLYEYLAAGLAVVATDVPPVTGVIEHGRTGLVVRPDDPAALAAGLSELAADPRRRRVLGRRGRALVEHRHTWDAVVRTILDLVPERAAIR